MKKLIAGVDEVGRGSLIGPVFAAAIILNNKIDKKKLKDSKKLSKIKLKTLEIYVKKNSIWAIGSASKFEIEKLNILNASLLAMKRAIKKLKKKPRLVLIDGNKVYKFDIDPYRKHCLLNGLDDIGITLESENKINSYEAKLKNNKWHVPEKIK